MAVIAYVYIQVSSEIVSISALRVVICIVVICMTFRWVVVDALPFYMTSYQRWSPVVRSDEHEILLRPCKSNK